MTAPVPDRDFVTFTVADQLFGAAVGEVREVFRPAGIAPVPLAPPHVAGVLNLRGRIVTTVCARSRLGLPPGATDRLLALGVERRGELYAVLVDGVEEVLRLPGVLWAPPPANLDGRWRGSSTGVYRLEGRLMVALDLQRLLEPEPRAAAA